MSTPTSSWLRGLAKNVETSTVTIGGPYRSDGLGPDPPGARLASFSKVAGDDSTTPPGGSTVIPRATGAAAASVATVTDWSAAAR